MRRILILFVIVIVIVIVVAWTRFKQTAALPARLLTAGLDGPADVVSCGEVPGVCGPRPRGTM